MKISTELIKRCSSRHLVAANEDNPFNRVTHLYLQEQNIDKIENLSSCKSLVALYLYDNKIERIENLDYLSNLTCLNLQNNRLTSVDNLNNLVKLKKLYLGHNHISVLENLESLTELSDLHIENQQLSRNEQVSFDQKSMMAIANSLTFLDISGNHLDSLSGIKCLQNVQRLDAKNNRLENIHDILDSVGQWTYLKTLRLNGNPVCKVNKYRDQVIVHCLDLEDLDMKDVHQAYRDFLLNWKQSRDLRERKHKSYEIIKNFIETQNEIDLPPLNIPGASKSISSGHLPSALNVMMQKQNVKHRKSPK